MTDRLRWGILGTGGIAASMTSDLLLTGHTVTAVGSRSQAGADSFAAAHGIPNAHPSYEALVADPEVDAVYVGTPHPYHAANATLALEAGKHVLLEKPFTINAAEADAIARLELSAAGLDNEIWQCPVVLLADVRSVGVQGDGRSYGHPIVLRPVSSEDAMTADWTRVPYEVLERISTRITNEVPEVNRVVLDVPRKPPGTIEGE